jgi:tRNA pseudouridine55 synthase
MGRRRKKGRALHGWLVLDKPYDFGSTEAVSKIRWLFDANKAGHAGTLDPLATGILPIALGEATKTVPFVQDGLKRYRFTARWGEATTTDDVEGEVTETNDHRPSAEDIEAVLPQFTGDIEQVPPAFSAIRVKGERAYDLARDGEEVKLDARPVTIHELVLLEVVDDDHAVFEALTGKGTYIRSLVRDIADALGTKAHVKNLRRTAVGPFTEDMAVQFEDLQGEPVTVNVDRVTLDQATLDGQLAPLEAGLAELPAASISGGDAERLRRGQEVVLAPAVAKGVRGTQVGLIPVVLASAYDEPVALCKLDGLKLKPSKVFVMS